MAVRLTQGVEMRDLSCGCRLSWKIHPKSWQDFARVDVSPGCTKSNHREEMGEPWKQ